MTHIYSKNRHTCLDCSISGELREGAQASPDKRTLPIGVSCRGFCRGRKSECRLQSALHATGLQTDRSNSTPRRVNRTRAQGYLNSLFPLIGIHSNLNTEKNGAHWSKFKSPPSSIKQMVTGCVNWWKRLKFTRWDLNSCPRSLPWFSCRTSMKQFTSDR